MSRSGVTIKDSSASVLRQILRACDEGLEAAAKKAAALSQNSMPGAGASAAKDKNGRLEYQPSEVGSPPGVRTGVLKASIGFERINYLQYRFGTNVKYGLYNEMAMGVPGRPFLWPIIAKKGNRLEAAFAEKAQARILRGTGAR